MGNILNLHTYILASKPYFVFVLSLPIWFWGENRKLEPFTDSPTDGRINNKWVKIIHVSLNKLFCLSPTCVLR